MTANKLLDKIIKDVEEFDASRLSLYGSAGAGLVKQNMLDYLKNLKISELEKVVRKKKGTN